MAAAAGEYEAALAERHDLDSVLRAWIDEGRRAWPTLELPDIALVEYLARRLPSGGHPALPSFRVADLFLACACLRGDPKAIQVLVDDYVRPLRSLLKRRFHNPDLVDEVSQSLATELLVADSNREPKLARYGGRGPLRGWLNAVAINKALRASENVARAPLARDEESLLAAASTEYDPELRQLKASSRNALIEAFRLAVSELPDRDKTLLRQHYVDSVPVEKLARLNQVHRVTMSRWLSKARYAALEHTRARLIDRFGLGGTECDSLIRFARSQVEITRELLDS